jgi:hypothetical protein
MKKFLSIIVLVLLIKNPLIAEVNTKNLNEFYNGCLDNAKRKNQYEAGVKICTCTVKIINAKLNNDEFEKIFNSDENLADKWMRKNLLSNCNYNIN